MKKKRSTKPKEKFSMRKALDDMLEARRLCLSRYPHTWDAHLREYGDEVWWTAISIMEKHIKEVKE